MRNQDGEGSMESLREILHFSEPRSLILPRVGDKI